MDKIKKYAEIIVNIITEMCHFDNADEESPHEEMVLDKENHNYYLMYIGFKDTYKFINEPIIHFKIKKDGKIWILANDTDIDISEDLMLKGVERQDIVLGFHPKHLREHTGFAIA